MLQKFAKTSANLQKFAETFANFQYQHIVAANHVGEMHEMHIYYLFTARTEHRSNDFQEERTSLRHTVSGGKVIKIGD